MTAKQVRLVDAIAWRLLDQINYRDLLREAAREVGLSQAEAILVLDQIVDERS